ncbi:hypothetical protein BKA62DRAFT_716786 [Auriculariales sp. MPI-PUGE-AT-0066]|nr:hypothetical protein BKA62DRAFT_716786 [Auriculariales sp. MPI-PUGE-AT-0066]
MDFSAALPLETRHYILRHVSRGELLRAGLLSRGWRDSARLDWRFCLCARLLPATTRESLAQVHQTNRMRRIIEYANDGGFGVSLYIHVEDLNRPEYIERMYFQSFCDLVELARIRLVRLYVHVPRHWLPLLDATLMRPAPALRIFEYAIAAPTHWRRAASADLYDLPSSLFSDHAPHLRCLHLAGVALLENRLPLAALAKVRNASLHYGGGVKVRRTDMLLALPLLHRLQIQMQDASLPCQLDLQAIASQLESLVGRDEILRLEPAIDLKQVHSLLLNDLTGSWNIANLLYSTPETDAIRLEVRRAITHSGSPLRMTGLLAIVSNLATGQQRVHHAVRRETETVLEGVFTRHAGRHVVHLRIDLDILPLMLSSPQWLALETLEMLIWDDWTSWPIFASNDSDPLSHDIELNSHKFAALRMIELCAVSRSKRVAKPMLDRLASSIALPGEKKSQTTLQLHNVVVVTLADENASDLLFAEVRSVAGVICDPKMLVVTGKWTISEALDS